jgi:DNA-binding response OmpR family regulator
MELAAGKARGPAAYPGTQQARRPAHGAPDPVNQRGLGTTDPAPDYDDGRLCVRPRDYLALADGAVLPLTVQDLALLAALTRNAGRVITRQDLREAAWEEDVNARAVDTAVARLRSKLAGALPEISYIHTHFRIGYRFAPEPPPDPK